MPVEVARVNESMTVEDLVPDTEGLVSAFATDVWPRLLSSKALQFVDPWGDTIFNQAQLPTLREELEEFGASLSSTPARAHLGKIVALIARAEGMMHTYVKFIGD